MHRAYIYDFPALFAVNRDLFTIILIYLRFLKIYLLFVTLDKHQHTHRPGA